MWVDEETYNNIMLGTFVGTIIGLMIAAVIWIVRITYRGNCWFYSFLRRKGLEWWQASLACLATTGCMMLFFFSPIVITGVSSFAQNAAQSEKKVVREKSQKHPRRGIR